MEKLVRLKMNESINPSVVTAVHDRLIVHVVAKEHSIEKKLEIYVDKFRQDEHYEMKPNYVTVSVSRSTVTKSKTRRQKGWSSDF